MTWEKIFQLSILMLCSLIMASPSWEIRPHDEHGITSGHVNGTLNSYTCSVDFPEKMADCSNRQLEDIPNNLINDLRSLDLSSNIIRSLWNTSFVRYSLLEKLDMSNNLIDFIALATFFPVDQLTSLSLDDNPIFTLPGSGIFQESKRLSSLSLRSCSLSYFPNDTLGFLPQLQSLDLTWNELTYINISKCPKRTLTTLDFSYNTIQEISADVIHLPCRTDFLLLGGMTSFEKIDADVVANFLVRTLDLFVWEPVPLHTFEVWKNLFTGIAQSEIDELFLVMAINVVPRDFFDPLRGKRLSDLCLAISEFKCYPSIFANLTSVYRMNLTLFHIGVLEPAFFDGMNELRSLTASVTEIKQVNPSGSSWKIDLRELDLSKNNFRSLGPFAFRGLTNLTFLDLSNNMKLLSISNTCLSGLDNLRTLNVSRTRIAQMTLCTPLLETFVLTLRLYDMWPYEDALFPGKTFQSTPYLNSIELNNSRVKLSELWDSSENISLFQGLDNLTYLGLKQNNIGILPSGIFDNLLALQVLDLSDCQISTIESGAFASMTSLTILSLQHNDLQILPLHIFDNLIHLSILIIGNNVLLYIDEALFAKTQMITSIDLARNQLSVFNQTTFSQISTTLSSVDLSQNPIECCCRSQWLIKLLHGTINVQNGKKTTCSFSSLKPFGGEALGSIQPNDLCTANFPVYFSTVFSIVIVVIVIVIAYHYRWQLRYKLFLLRLAILGYREILDENDREDYDFDVYVISTEDDENWIQDQLKPYFQGFPYFKRSRNVFTDDDLPLGMHRTEAVDHVLRRSFKILVLLSKTACADDWFLTCFRMALDQVADTQTENIILVFLENITEDVMPFHVRLYMRGQGPYVEWVEDDDEGQKYFWKRLQKCLSVNRKRNHFIPAE